MRNLICLVFGHDWDKGFAETRCRRCPTVKTDRLYHVDVARIARAVGYGEGLFELYIPEEGVPGYTLDEQFRLLCHLALWGYLAAERDAIEQFAAQGFVKPDEEYAEHGTLTVLGREWLARLVRLTAPQAEAA